MAKRDVNVIIKARDQASKKFGLVGKRAMGMGAMLKRAAGMAAAYFGARQVMRFAASSVRAFTVQEDAVRHLTDALHGLGKARQVDDMKAFASEIQKLTTIGDEATLELLSMGASMGKLSGESLKAATTAAIGLSKAFKMDTTAAMRLVARAAQGDTASLSRYGIKLGEALTGQEKFNKVLEIGAQNFHLAEGETKTFSGVTNQLSNAWGDAKEKIGAYIANSPGLQKAMKIARIGIQNFGTVMDIVWTKAGLTMVEFWEDTKHLFAVQIPELWAWFVNHWKEVLQTLWSFVKAGWRTLGNWMVRSIKTAWNFLKEFGKASWNFIKNPAKGINLSDTFAAVGQGIGDIMGVKVLDGFENKIKQMPKLTARQMTPVEKALAESLTGSKQVLRDAMAEGLKDATLDTAGLLAGAAAEGFEAGAGKGKTGLGKTGGGLAAVESRFLGGGAERSPYKKMEGSLTRIERILAKQLKRQEIQEQRERRGGQVVPMQIVTSLA